MRLNMLTIHGKKGIKILNYPICKAKYGFAVLFDLQECRVRIGLKSGPSDRLVMLLQ